MDLEKIIEEKLKGPSRTKNIFINGCVLPKKFGFYKNDIEQLEVYDSDIWICSYPKSGTTWTQEMIWLIANNLDYEGAKESLDTRFPFLEKVTLYDFEEMKKENPNFRVDISYQDTVELVKSMKSPRFIKTHLPLQLWPLQLRNGIKKPKIIYVARNPKDACVSFFYHTKLLNGYDVTFDEFCEIFLADKYTYEPYWDHVLTFWKMRNQANVLFLKYEDMKKDLKQVIRQTAKFLNRTLNDEDVEKLANYLSFDSMQKNPAVNKEKSVEFLQKLQKRHYDGKFIRKGIVGDYRNAMKAETIDKFEEWIQKHIEEVIFFDLLSKMDLEKLIEEKLKSPVHKRDICINGFMIPNNYKLYKNEIDQLEVYDSDIWVCTFPKCGTTWTQEMVWLIANNLDYEKAKESLDTRFPFLERVTLRDFEEIEKENPNIKSEINYQDSIELVKSMKSPRFIKTHLPLQLCPTQLRNGIKKPKIIYVTRNPKDVCVSYYYHTKIFDGYKLTFEEFCELFLAGKITFEPYWDHVLPFWKMKNQPNVLFLKYENMKKDLKQVIRQTAKFLDRSLNDEDVEILANYLSFDSMQKNPAVNKETSINTAQKLQKRQINEKFIRKGIVGDYKNLMSPEIIDKFEKWTEKHLKSTDYFI